jgi:hypothetical protein
MMSSVYFVSLAAGESPGRSLEEQLDKMDKSALGMDQSCRHVTHDIFTYLNVTFRLLFSSIFTIATFSAFES